ncbi:uncharacterized protein AAGF69_015388 isoform 1-T1 [Amazona ochrocephala]
MVLRTEVMIKMFDSLERLTQLSLICMPVGNLGKVKRADQAWRLGYLLHPSQNYSDLVLNMSCPGCKNGEQRPGRVRDNICVQKKNQPHLADPIQSTLQVSFSKSEGIVELNK